MDNHHFLVVFNLIVNSNQFNNIVPKVCDAAPWYAAVFLQGAVLPQNFIQSKNQFENLTMVLTKTITVMLIKMYKLCIILIKCIFSYYPLHFFLILIYFSISYMVSHSIMIGKGYSQKILVQQGRTKPKKFKNLWFRLLE